VIRETPSRKIRVSKLCLQNDAPHDGRFSRTIKVSLALTSRQISRFAAIQAMDFLASSAIPFSFAGLSCACPVYLELLTRANLY
jgi:hypothetical protein